MREDEPRDPSLALCQICKRAYWSKTSVRDYSNDDQIREYRTCPLLFTGDCNGFVPLNPNDPQQVLYAQMNRAKYGRFD